MPYVATDGTKLAAFNGLDLMLHNVREVGPAALAAAVSSSEPGFTAAILPLATPQAISPQNESLGTPALAATTENRREKLFYRIGLWMDSQAN